MRHTEESPKYGVLFDDSRLRDDILGCFGDCLAALECMYVHVVGEQAPYTVVVGSEVLGVGLSRAMVVGVLDGLVDVVMRARVSKCICTLHSFGVASQAGAVAIVGVSGSGKTTLGLASLMRGCGLLGDEYGYLDLDTCTYWHAPHPIAVKDGAEELLGTELPEGLMSLSRLGIRSTLINTLILTSSLGSRLLNDVPMRLAAVLLPRRHAGAINPVLERVSVADMPHALMPSLQGAGARDVLFRKFLSMVSKHDVDVMVLNYSNAVSASRIIASKGVEW